MKNNWYYVGDLFTKIGAGAIGGSIVAVQVTEIKSTPTLFFVTAVVIIIVGIWVMKKYEA